VSIKVFLSENLPEKKDNILSVISFDGEVDYKDSVLTSGPQILNRKNIYEIWEVQDKVFQEKYNDINLSRSKNYIFGFVMIDAGSLNSYEEIKENIRKKYKDFFGIANQNSMSIIKIWHYLPQLLKTYADSKTNYSLLCEAREVIYKEKYKDSSFPAATVIGIEGNKILIYFLAAACKEYNAIENKRQVSSYDYPQNIFLEKPMFSRAVSFTDIEGADKKIIISGTASIKGYESIHSMNVLNQLDEALKNYQTFVNIKGNNTNLCRIYLTKSQKIYSAEITKKLDNIFDYNNYILLEGEICRNNLLIEIEGISKYIYG